MMRSMFSGVSGLRTHQTKMDVIANNISNVNTVGYKASRVTFKEVFTQTISGASAANPDAGRGGVNPMQIGLGVNVGSIDKLMTQGAAQRTDNTMDVMIQGDSFLIVTDESGTYFTRAGAMYLDEASNLAMSGSDGMLINGWKAVPEMVEDSAGNQVPTGDYVIDKSTLAPISITGDYAYISPEATTTINYDGNLNAATNDEKTTKMDFYDSLGNRYVMDVKFTYVPPVVGTGGAVTTSAYWSVERSNTMYLDGDTKKPVTIVANPANGATGDYTQMTTLAFDADGNMTTTVTGTVNPAPNPEYKFTLDGSGLSPASSFGADPNAGIGTITVNFADMTQFNATADASAQAADGSKPGLLNGTSLGADGILTGRYSNGETRAIAQVAVTTFDNPAGLEKVGNNLFVTTSNSGDFNGQGEEVAATGGSFLVGNLEMSNVDLSSEFTEMITTQRGFQANSKIITTSDELLQELVNLKR